VNYCEAIVAYIVDFVRIKWSRTVRRRCIYVRRARLCEWNGTEVLDTGQLMEVLNICFTTNLGDQQVVIAI
jgi:hypothetical protein